MHSEVCSHCSFGWGCGTTYLLAFSGNVVLCKWIFDQALAIYINSKYFLTVVSRFWKFKKNWSPSYLRVMLIKMGPSNEDIWILDFGILDLALNNGNVFDQLWIDGFMGFWITNLFVIIYTFFVLSNFKDRSHFIFLWSMECLELKASFYIHNSNIKLY
jgi:hypothetical protein